MRIPVGEVIVRGIKLSLFVAIISLPFSAIITNVSLLTWCGLSLLNAVTNEKNKRGKDLSIAFLPVTILIVYLISFLYSSNLRRAVSTLELGMFFLVVPLSVHYSSSILDSGARVKGLKIFFWTIFVACAVAYVSIVVRSGKLFPDADTAEFTYHDDFSRYAFSYFLNDLHPTYLAIFIVFAFIVLIEYIALAPWLKWIFAACLLFFLLILSSKSQIIIFAIILVMVVWHKVNLRRRLKVLLAIGVLALFVLLLSFNRQVVYRFTTEMQSATGTDRLVMWRVGRDIIADHPLLGVGIGDRNDVVNERLTERRDLAGLNLHNQYIDYMIALGIPGLIALLIVLFYPITVQPGLAFKLFLMLIGFSLLTESLLYRQWGVHFFVIFYCLLGSQHPLRFSSTKNGI